MSTADMIGDRRDMRHDPRVKAARLSLVVDSLVTTVLFNPLGTFLACLALYYGQAVFGTVSFAACAWAVGLQVASGVVAWAAQHHLEGRVERQPDYTQNILVGVQVFIAFSWGGVCWLLWCQGNAANNILVSLLMICVLWSSVFMRSSVPPVYLAGVVVLSLMVGLRYFTDGGTAALVMLSQMPFWTAYILSMGWTGKRRVDEALIARFANEDMGHALRKARDQALEQRWEAEAANAAKTAFLANMSHELRTPLNAILGFSDLIAYQRLGVDHERYADYAHDIHASGSHLLSLINDLLDVAKIEAGKMEIEPVPLDPTHALADVARLMASKAEAKGQSLAFPPEGSAPWIKADERAFKQIALNLVSNALKFTPEGGRIAVSCARAPEGGLNLCVEDNGPGIPREKLTRVFQAFSQVDNRYDRNAGGTGLGLSLVQGLAKLHGGHAWIESEEGQGTKVFVHFPVVIEARSAAPQLFFGKF